MNNEAPEQLTGEDLQDIKQKSVIGATSYFIRTLFLQGIGFVSVAVLSAFFSPEDFGIYGFVVQIIGILIFFSDVGLAAALIQKKNDPTITEYRTAFTVQQLLSWVIVAVIGIIIATGLVQSKTGMTGVWILLALGISFPLATLKTIPSVILERELDFSKLVVPQIFEQITFHGILIYLAWSGMGAMAYTYAIVARSVIGAIVMWLLQPWKIGLALSIPALRGLIGFGVKFQLNDFLARIKDQLFFLVIGFVLPLRQFGYIQWAKNWSLYPYNLTVQNVMAITFPTFSRLQSHKKALATAIEKSLYFISLAIFPLLVGMSLFIYPLLDVIPGYAKWYPAAASLIFFSLGVVWSAISTPLTNTLNAIGEIDITLKLMLLWTSLTWMITPIFVLFFDYHGVAIASFVIACTSFLPIIYVKRSVPFSFFAQIWRQLLGIVVMGAITAFGWQYWGTSAIWLMAGIISAGLGYTAVVIGLGWNKFRSEVQSLRS